MSVAPRLILASRSPQREAILRRLGLEFEIVASDAEELTTGEPRALVIENALRKARAVARAIGDEAALVIGADTVIADRGEILSKPADADEAAAFMRRLSGHAHEVVGGLALVGPAAGAGAGAPGAGRPSERTAATATRVCFRELSERQIAAYVATGEWRDRSGGYAVQQGGSILVGSIEGDYLNIIGLSVNDLLRLAPELLIA